MDKKRWNQKNATKILIFTIDSNENVWENQILTMFYFIALMYTEIEQETRSINAAGVQDRLLFKNSFF